MKDDNIIFVGRKPSMSYVLALVTQLGLQQEVHVKARGQSISKAVDVVEIVRNKFMPDLKVSGITIGTDTVKMEEKDINVSSISISVKKVSGSESPFPST
jgi:DNA-binding protein